MFKLPVDMTEAAMSCLQNAAMARYAGDEKLLPPEAIKINEFNELFPGNPVVPLINNFWSDLPPSDDKLLIKLK